MSSTPSSCPDTNNDGIPDPSMYLTIIADNDSLPRTWCGETWIEDTIPLTGSHADDHHSGDTAEVCPTIYTLSPYPSVTHSEYWRNRHTNGYDFAMSRRYQFGSGKSRRHNVMVATDSGSDRWTQLYQGPDSGWTTQNTICNISIFCGNQGTTKYNYKIDADQLEGSWVGALNVTYKWERGNGW